MEANGTSLANNNTSCLLFHSGIYEKELDYNIAAMQAVEAGPIFIIRQYQTLLYVVAVLMVVAVIGFLLVRQVRIGLANIASSLAARSVNDAEPKPSAMKEPQSPAFNLARKRSQEADDDEVAAVPGETKEDRRL